MDPHQDILVTLAEIENRIAANVMRHVQGVVAGLSEQIAVVVAAIEIVVDVPNRSVLRIAWAMAMQPL